MTTRDDDDEESNSRTALRSRGSCAPDRWTCIRSAHHWLAFLTKDRLTNHGLANYRSAHPRSGNEACTEIIGPLCVCSAAAPVRLSLFDCSFSSPRSSAFLRGF